MTVRIGINGLGRIGRALVRVAAATDDLDIIAVNELMPPEEAVRLLRHDSTFGPFTSEIDLFGDTLVIDGHKVAITSIPDAMRIPWAEHALDVVVDCTGRLRTSESAAAHLTAGARKVLISAPAKGVDATIVMGVNDETFDATTHHIVSNASCTTNCVAPMVKVLHEAFGLEHGFMTTVHAYTNDQNLLDGYHKDSRRARSAAVNIIPTSTGAAKAVGVVLPELAGRLDGIAIRVPVVDGSLVDLAALLDQEVTVEAVNAAFREAGEHGSLVGRLRYTAEPVVSTDVIGTSDSCLFDSELTQASGRLVKVFGWYDNEWGYTCRLADLARLMGHDHV